MKKVLIGLACLLLITGCKDVKLSNGEKAVVTFEEGAISSDELYTALKNQYGGSVVTNLIDKYLLDKKYEDDKETKDYVNQTIKSIKSSAKEAGTTFEVYASAFYGMSNTDDLKDYLSLDYKRNKWAEEYAKETVTDKQIKEYYETEVYGDIEASQILITVDVKDGASDTDKTKAENAALDQAKKIIQELKDGKDFAELAKKYSKDESSASNGGSLGKVNDGDLADEALDALRNLKDGSYTTSAVKSSYGYHILYRTSQDKKQELTDELKETIKTTVGSEIAKEDGFSAKALKALREQNNMKFVDTDLEKSYETSNK